MKYSCNNDSIFINQIIYDIGRKFQMPNIETIKKN